MISLECKKEKYNKNIVDCNVHLNLEVLTGVVSIHLVVGSFVTWCGVLLRGHPQGQLNVRLLVGYYLRLTANNSCNDGKSNNFFVSEYSSLS